MLLEGTVKASRSEFPRHDAAGLPLAEADQRAGACTAGDQRHLRVEAVVQVDPAVQADVAFRVLTVQPRVFESEGQHGRLGIRFVGLNPIGDQPFVETVRAVEKPGDRLDALSRKGQVQNVEGPSHGAGQDDPAQGLAA